MPVSIGGPPQASFDRPLDLLKDCHRRIERFLDILVRVTETCCGGGLDEEHRTALVTALEYFRSAALKHTEDEESSLFPRLRQASDPRARQSLEVLKRLEDDHIIGRQAHERIDRLARQWLTEGRLGSVAVTELGEVLQELQATYERHIRIEDETVFPLAGDVLSTELLAQIGDEMRRRRGLESDSME